VALLKPSMTLLNHLEIKVVHRVSTIHMTRLYWCGMRCGRCAQLLLRINVPTSLSMHPKVQPQLPIRSLFLPILMNSLLLTEVVTESYEDSDCSKQQLDLLDGMKHLDALTD
jgi:hypothetical protein